MSDYAQVTSFTPKDSLASGNPAKLILGALFDAEFSAISTAIATKFDSADIASNAQADAGSSDTVLMTPAKVVRALQNLTVTLGANVLPAADAITNTHLANMAQTTVKGRASGAGTGDPTDLTAAQLVTIINTADGAASGLDADLLDGVQGSGYALASHTHAAADITSGTFVDARVAQSNVTQHQAALSLAASQLASGTLADARVAASNVTQHQASLSIAGSQIASVPGSGVVSSGTYTPTHTAGTNVDSVSALTAQWIRIGNVVTVSGAASVDATSSAATTQFTISLPIASNLTTAGQLAGIASQGPSQNPGTVVEDTTNDRATASFVATTTVAANVYFTFTYVIA